MAKALPCSRLRGLSAVFIAAVFLSAPSLLPAYQRHLSEDDVREAWLFGQRHDLRVAKWFDAYEKNVPLHSKPGEPRVRAIGVRTPYSLVVLRSFQGGNTYSGLQAWKDYTNVARTFEVVVWVDYPINSLAQSNIADPTPLVLNTFAVEVASRDRELSSRKVTVALQNALGTDAALAGAELHYEYDVKNVASAVLRIEASNRLDSTVSAEFDLSDLR